MKIKFLGTAAYEGIPGLFCNCRVCRESREKGGRNLRSRSQALINGELLIDFNADTVWHYHRYGFDWNRIRACIITHAHCDHLYPEDIEMAARGFSSEHAPAHFYAAERGYQRIKEYSDRTGGGADVTLVKAGERFTVADGKYEILPIKANHAPEMSPVFFAISCENKRMLYAHDTGYFFDEAWELLRGEGRFDLVSLDCTGALLNGWREGHMSFDTDLEVFERMKDEGLIDNKTTRVINHFSHNGNATHDELVAAAEPHGVIVSYDGLELEV